MFWGAHQCPMAVIEKRGDSWRARITRKGFPRESATFPTRAQAVEWSRMREGELVGQRYGLAPKRTVRQALERWRDEVSPDHRGHRWEAVRVDKMLRELPFADRLLADVQKSEVAAWRDSLARRLAPESVRREYGILRAVFGLAAGEWEWLKASPFDRSMTPPPGRPRKRRVTDAEAATICAALGYPATPGTASWYVGAAFLWCIQTAMRQGEALSLERDQVSGRVANLLRTKNGDEREVPLTREALALLEQLPREGYLFPIASGTCDALFRRAKQSAGLADINFHDSRREGTSRLARKVDVLTLAKITGHRDVKMLLRVYYRPDMAEVADRLD